MNIVVIGTGYVGLVSGTVFAETGHNVTCVDINEDKINTLKKGDVPIYEPGLKDILERNVKQNRLHFSTSISESIPGAEVVFIAVGTPPGGDGETDLSFVLNAANDIASAMTGDLLIVNKSTVPVGTAVKVHDVIDTALRERGVAYTFDVVSNPEFLKEGNAVKDSLQPDRIIVGVNSEASKVLMEKLYQPFIDNGHHILFMDVASAEVTKYAANAMLSVRISFMNEIANFCDAVGANIKDVQKGIGSDERIGPKFLNAGIGFGGSCFPKDILSLMKAGETHHVSMHMSKAAYEVNTKQKYRLIEKAKERFGDISGKNIAIWGLSFKPQTDDTRAAPALLAIEELLKEGCHVSVFDPVAMPNVKTQLGDAVFYADNHYDALNGADCLMIYTEWNVFKSPDFDKMKSLLKDPVIFDGRNLYKPSDMAERGFFYYGIGIQHITP